MCRLLSAATSKYDSVKVCRGYHDNTLFTKDLISLVKLLASTFFHFLLFLCYYVYIFFYRFGE